LKPTFGITIQSREVAGFAFFENIDHAGDSVIVDVIQTNLCLLGTMAKNSDKRAVVEKRRVELLHAIRGEFSEDQILTRVEKLRFAIFKFIKKEFNGRSSGAPNGLVEKWDSMSAERIIVIANSWPKNPTIRNVVDAQVNEADRH